MFDTLTNTEFRNLYNTARDARLAGTKVIKAKLGDVETERETTINVGSADVWAALAAEFRLRFPTEVGRTRNTRAVARFC